MAITPNKPPEDGETQRFRIGRQYDLRVQLVWATCLAVIVLGGLGIGCYYLLHRTDDAPWVKILLQVVAPSGLIVFVLRLVYRRMTPYSGKVRRRLDDLQ